MKNLLIISVFFLVSGCRYVGAPFIAYHKYKVKSRNESNINRFWEVAAENLENKKLIGIWEPLLTMRFAKSRSHIENIALFNNKTYVALMSFTVAKFSLYGTAERFYTIHGKWECLGNRNIKIFSNDKELVFNLDNMTNHFQKLENELIVLRRKSFPESSGTLVLSE
jgi:hypothetical protein